MSKTWSCQKRGIRKETLPVNINNVTMKKATEISKCLVKISDVQNLNGRPTNFIQEEATEQWIELISAVTPVDYYIGLLLQEIREGETSRCFIKTKLGEEISFVVTMMKIDNNKYLFQLNPCEMFDLANKYKMNGVIMFKKYPVFANEYFIRAAKFLISYKPFEVLSKEADGIEPSQFENLLQTLKMNISACHIKNNRFEDVLFLTKFVEDTKDAPEKAIYRRALAFYGLNKYEEAKEIIEKMNYRDNTECSGLYKNILIDLKKSNDNYKKIVKKMFG